MNVKELNEKYQRIQNWQDEYRKELVSYINEAFAMHGNVFELKPKDCETWEEADEMDEGLNAMDRIPTFLTIYDKYSDSHEIYPTKIYRHEGGCTEYVNGYDYGECTFTEGWEADCDMESLQAIATFINTVLEQESRKYRTFKQGERVFNCEYCEGDRDLHDWATVCHDTEVEEEDAIVLIEMENGGENETTAESLYQIAEGKVCPRCGGPLCIEHHDEIDYPYFCPSCDENFYGIEVQ